MKRKLLTMSALALICGMSVACNNNKDSNSTNTSQNSTTSQDSTNNANTNVKITEEQAKEIALKDAKVSENDVIFAKSQLETDDGVLFYDVEFYSKTKQYDYKIDANNGAVLESDSEIENFSTQQNNSNSSTNSNTSNSSTNSNTSNSSTNTSTSNTNK